MSHKLKSNGFGSFHKKLIFTVTNDFSEQLNEAGWSDVGEHAGGTYFEYSFTSRGAGDDGEALRSLACALPENVPDNVWRVLWGRSQY
jgi:hypothetical protein